MPLETLEEVANPQTRRERRQLRRLVSSSGSLQLIVHGDVQGVGFRNFVRRRAERRGLRGWVRNRSDGTVEIVVGDRVCLPAVIDVMELARKRFEVESIEVRWSDEDVSSTAFAKKRDLFLLEDPALHGYYERLNIDPGGEAFGPLHTAGLLANYREPSLREAQHFWRERWAVDIDPALHLAFERFVGQADPRVVPPKQYRRIQRMLNSDPRTERAYTDKNLYDLLVSTDRQPLSYVRRANGRYFDAAKRPLARDHLWESLREVTDRAIIKPARTANGRKVALLTIEEGEGRPYIDGQPRSIRWIERNYGRNFLIQEVLGQHAAMARVHPGSVNTLRMLTLRHEREVHHLLTFARFGVGGRINDNAGTGGICVGVNHDGSFHADGLDVDATRITRHPTTNVLLSTLDPVPDYGEFRSFVVDLHARDILHHDLVSWDISVGPDGQPVFLEHNFRGAMWIYQLATKQPVFGDLTEGLLASLKKS